jgi:hypothetical protein
MEKVGLPTVADLKPVFKSPVLAGAREELLRAAGLPKTYEPGKYDYEKENILYKVGVEALAAINQEVFPRELAVTVPEEMVKQITTRGGLVQVLISYSEARLKKLISEWSYDSFDVEPGKGETDYEKVISWLKKAD